MYLYALKVCICDLIFDITCAPRILNVIFENFEKIENQELINITSKTRKLLFHLLISNRINSATEVVVTCFCVQIIHTHTSIHERTHIHTFDIDSSFSQPSSLPSLKFIHFTVHPLDDCLTLN